MRTKSDRAALRLLGFLSTLPVFINLGNGIGLGELPRRVEARSGGFDVPIGSVVLPMLIGLVILGFIMKPSTRIGKFTLMDAAALSYLMVNIVSLAAGITLNPKDIDQASYFRFAQTVSPLVWYAVGRYVVAGDIERLRVVLAAAFATVAAAAAVLVFATMVQGLNDETGLAHTIGPYNNSKSLRFFPTLSGVAAGYHLSHAVLDKRGRIVPVCAALTCTAVVLFSYSRTALLVLALAYASAAFAALKHRDLSLALPVVAAAGLVLLLAAPALVEADWSISLSRVEGEGAEQSNLGHYERSIASFKETASLPLGRMYATNVTQERGLRTTYEGVIDSENQFGEAGGRAGPVAFVAIVVLLVNPIFRLMKMGSVVVAETSFVHFLKFLLVVGMVLTSFLQISLTEAYYSSVCWLVLGALAYAENGRSAKRLLARPAPS
jgi:hypothetical protein